MKAGGSTAPNSIEVTEAMVRAGLRTLLYDYDNKFDPVENNPEGFVTRIYEVMQEARLLSKGTVG